MTITFKSQTSKVQRQEILLPIFSAESGRPDWPYFPSLSWMRNLGSWSSKHAFRTCCFTHSIVGCSVTLKWSTFRLASSMMTNT